MLTINNLIALSACMHSFHAMPGRLVDFGYRAAGKYHAVFIPFHHVMLLGILLFYLEKSSPTLV